MKLNPTQPVIGIIAEWNPFHLGHAAMIRNIQNQYPEATFIAAMSGSFVQRGEPALFDKWTRARWALESGIHIVFELPALYALQSADLFASYGVTLLSHTSVTHLAFSTESLTKEELQDAATWATSEEYLSVFHEALGKGISYGQAAYEAMAHHSPYLAEELSKPNNLLGFRYVETILRHQYPIDILVNHRDMAHNISATTARKELLENKETMLLPPQAIEEARKLMEIGAYTDPTRYEDSCLLCSRQLTLTNLAQSGLFREGLEHKWYKETSAPTYTAMLDGIKSKRYLYSRLKRIGAQLLLSGIHSPSPFSHLLPPGYLKLLGLRQEKSRMLKQCTLPVYPSTAKAMRDLPPAYQAMLSLDIQATNLRAYCQAAPAMRKGREDFYHSPVIVRIGGRAPQFI